MGIYLEKLPSIYDGLSELESDFLRNELRMNYMRTNSQLRRIAKKKAMLQMLKWCLQDTMAAAGIAVLMLTILFVAIIYLV